MAYGPVGDVPTMLGCFRESEHGQIFEYKPRPFADMLQFAPTMPHLVYVGSNQETRPALIRRTVAHVVVDENPDGSPVVERWTIRSHRVYGERKY
jgi:hypothetical protein